MRLKYYGLAALCLLASISTLQGHMTKKAAMLATGAGLSTVLLGMIQHRYSRLAHERYPLMQRRAALNALLLKEKQAEMIDPLRAELALIQSKIDALHLKRSDYSMLRTVLGIATALLGGSAAYEYTTTKPDAPEPKKK